MVKGEHKYDRIVITGLAICDFVALVIFGASWSAATLFYLLLNWIFNWRRDWRDKE